MAVTKPADDSLHQNVVACAVSAPVSFPEKVQLF